MNLNQLHALAFKYFQLSNKKWFVPDVPDIASVTGEAVHDALIHEMLSQHGVELILKQNDRGLWKLSDYRVVDDNKFMLFLLKWA
jgi:hypothetical protein